MYSTVSEFYIFLCFIPGCVDNIFLLQMHNILENKSALHSLVRNKYFIPNISS
jgi:hypothetical protein